MKRIPTTPDYMKIYEQKAIQEEKLNKPDKKFGPKWLYRGDVYLGKILTFNEQDYKVEIKDEKGRETEPAETKKMITLTFRPHLIGRFHRRAKNIVRILRDEIVFEGQHKLILPSNLSLTNLGNEYVSQNNFKFISQVLTDTWNKRLLENSANATANQMLKISGFVTEFAQERQLKELEIKKMQEEKKLRQGSII